MHIDLSAFPRRSSQWEESAGEALIAEEGNDSAGALELRSTGEEEEQKPQWRWKTASPGPIN